MDKIISKMQNFCGGYVFMFSLLCMMIYISSIEIFNNSISKIFLYLSLPAIFYVVVNIIIDILNFKNRREK